MDHNFYPDLLSILREDENQSKLTQSRKKELKTCADNYVILHGKLYYQHGHNRYPVLTAHVEQQNAIRAAHILPDGIHNDRQSTLADIMATYHWRGMKLDVEEYLSKCTMCSSLDESSTQEPTKLFSPGDLYQNVWKQVIVEIFGPLPKSADGSTYAVALIDDFSQWIETKPLQDKNEVIISHFILENLSRFGFAVCIFYGCDKSFLNKVSNLIVRHWRSISDGESEAEAFVSQWRVETNLSEDSNNSGIGKYSVNTQVDNVKHTDDQIKRVNLSTVNELEQVRRSPSPSDENASVVPPQCCCKNRHDALHFKLQHWFKNCEVTWAEELSQVVHRLRISPTEDEGLTPFRMMFDRARWRQCDKQMPSAFCKGSSLISPRKKQVVQRKRGRRGRGRGKCRDCNYTCSKCGELFNVKMAYALHVRGHLREDRLESKKQDGHPHTDKQDNVLSTRLQSSTDKKVDPVHDDIKTVVQAKTKSYGLRTMLKASGQSAVVHRMLLLSRNKRSSSMVEDEPNTNITASQKPLPSPTQGTKKRKVGRPKKVPLREEIPGVHEKESTKSMEVIVYDTNMDTNKDVEGIDHSAEIKCAISAITVPEVVADVQLTQAQSINRKEVQEVEPMDSSVELDISEEYETDDMTSNEISDEEYEPMVKKKRKTMLTPISTNFQCPKCFVNLILPPKGVTLHMACHKDDSRLVHCPYCTFVAGTWIPMQEHLLTHSEGRDVLHYHTTANSVPSTEEDDDDDGSLYRDGLEKMKRCKQKKRVRKIVETPVAKIINDEEQMFTSVPTERCDQCPGLEFLDQTELDVHLQCHKKGSRFLYCPHCPHFTGRWTSMKDHLVSHPEALPLSEVEKHISINKNSDVYIRRTEEGVFYCEQCKLSLRGENNVGRHLRMHAIITYQCDQCTYSTRIWSELTTHRNFHLHQGYKCNFCDKCFAKKDNLKAHYQVHNENRQAAVCEKCGLKLTGMIALRRHIRNMHGEHQHWPCSHCNYVGKNRIYLRKHVLHLHNKPMKCQMCDYGCHSEAAMTKHMDIFHNESGRRFPCPSCAYRGRDAKQLAEHVRFHHNPNAPQFQCEYCDARFRSLTMLRDHLPLHTKQYSFECQVCGYRARYRRTMYRHAQTKHPGVPASTVLRGAVDISTSNPSSTPRTRTRMRRIDKVKAPTDDRASAKVEPPIDESDCQPTSMAHLALLEVDEDYKPDSASYVSTADASGNGNSLFGTTATAENVIITTQDGETVTFDGDHRIVLDASLLAQSGGTLTLPDNIQFQIIHTDKEGEKLAMQIIPSQDSDDADKAMGMLLLAIDPNRVVTTEDVESVEETVTLVASAAEAEDEVGFCATGED